VQHDGIKADSYNYANQFGGPEYSIKQIFSKARSMAPCYLILEDLDSIISDDVRSYFLNEVDGLTSNDGIFMVGSTNHLDRLDEGVSVSTSPLLFIRYIADLLLHYAETAFTLRQKVPVQRSYQG
jgi:hypothetical protein